MMMIFIVHIEILIVFILYYNLDDYWNYINIKSTYDQTYYYNKTLLVDDDENNLNIAENVGINVCHIKNRRGLTENDWNKCIKKLIK